MQNPPRGQALAPAGQGECSTPIPFYQAFYGYSNQGSWGIRAGPGPCSQSLVELPFLVTTLQKWGQGLGGRIEAPQLPSVISQLPQLRSMAQHVLARAPPFAVLQVSSCLLIALLGEGFPSHFTDGETEATVGSVTTSFPGEALL